MVANIASERSLRPAVVEMPDVLTRTSVSSVVSAVLDTCRRDPRADVVIDVTSVQQVDMHGLAALINCRRRAIALGVTLSLSTPSPTLREALARTGLLHCFRFGQVSHEGNR